MKKIILSVILFSTLTLFGEVLKEWSFDNGKFTDIQIMKPLKAKILSEKAPDGSTAASFTLAEDTLGKKPWICCLRFTTKQDVAAGTKYVYKFYAKSETKTTFSANCQMLISPWKYIGGGEKFTLTNEWQEFSVEFTSSISASGSAAMPHFFFGDMPKGTSITISKMTLEKN